MISLSKLILGESNYGDGLRYTDASRHQVHGAAEGKGPVVVWNITRSCNLKCIHCYADAVCGNNPDELSTKEAESVLDDLADFKVPVVLFSGGEPLIRKDIFHVIEYAVKKGLRPVISTNGTLITKEVAKTIKSHGVSYVGVSLDGVGKSNDEFRRSKGAYDDAIAGIRNCIEVGQKVGLRFTISKHTYGSLEAIFDLIEREKIPRVCFYHLAYSGRGLDLKDADVTREESRKAIDLIISKTLDFHKRGINVEILTVDNHADGIYIYQWAKKNAPEKAEGILKLLRNNGGNRSGVAIGNIDWLGDVHPDQFTRDVLLGNVRQRKFSEIWTDKEDPVLVGLRSRKSLIEGRCSKCQWFDCCNGNFRARATVLGSFWASDPACYLTDAEIGLE